MTQSFGLDDARRQVSLFGAAIADNGLSYGFEYKFFDGTGAAGARVFLSNRFGRLDMGATETATSALDITGDNAMAGRGTWARGGFKNVNLGRVEGLDVVSVAGSDAGTIRYTTPNYGGLTLAVSFTNETDGDMIDGSGPTTSEDVVSIATRYISSYGNYTTVLYGGYEKSNNGEKLSARGNQEIISAGALVSGMGTRFALGWGRTQNDLAADAAVKDEVREWYDIGLGFSRGPWGIAVGGAHVVDEAVLATRAIDTEVTAFSVGAEYRLAPGLTLAAGVTHVEIDNGDYSDAAFAGTLLNADNRADNSATTFTLATQVSF